MRLFFQILIFLGGITIFIYLYLLVYLAGRNITLTPTHVLDKFGLVCLGEKCFKVEVAETKDQIELGLMNREELDEDKGMLFIFNKEGIYPFWMKNTLIPLDIIWINKDSEIVFIGQNVKPCKSLICPLVLPRAMAIYVLEINSGLCGSLGIKVGDKISIDIN